MGTALMGTALMGMAAGPAVAAASTAPPGNNGTIKIDQVPIDAGHDNDPHVGCTFALELFGFDGGTNTAHVSFDGQPPTGGGLLLADTFSFSGQARTQGGATFDTARPYDLAAALAHLAPAQQGFHVKVSASVDGGPPKHKVFWVTGCSPLASVSSAAASAGSAASAGPGSATTTSPPAAAPQSGHAAALLSGTGPPTTSASAAATPAAVGATSVLGESIVRSASAGAVVASSASTRAASGSLPLTGIDILGLVLAGMVAVAGGLGLVLFTRHRRDLLAERS